MTCYIPESRVPLNVIFYLSIVTISFFTHFYGAKTDHEVHLSHCKDLSQFGQNTKECPQLGTSSYLRLPMIFSSYENISNVKFQPNKFELGSNKMLDRF